MSDLKVLHRGGKSDLARELQAATNRRLISRGLNALVVKEDGVIGAETLNAVRKAAWALGAQSSTYEAIIKTGAISIGVQRMIRNPGLRSDDQMTIAKRRMAQLRVQRKKQLHDIDATSSRQKAVNAFLAKVGTVESPPGSNGGGVITVMEAYWGFGRVPWCGISAGYHAKVFGGVDALRSDVASVSAIEGHARRGDSPYVRWVSDVSSLPVGSLIVLGGSGVHVGMKRGNLPGGGAKTVEGNTSFGPGGSQSNGGCIAARERSDAEIYGGCPLNYPG